MVSFIIKFNRANSVNAAFKSEKLKQDIFTEKKNANYLQNINF